MKTHKLISLSISLVSTLSAVTASHAFDVTGTQGTQISIQEITRFDEPWAMTFLPDGQLLVTQKSGELFLLEIKHAKRRQVSGVPKVAYGGQGGLGDIILHPGFAENHRVYLSYAEEGSAGTRGAVVARARFSYEHARLEDLEIIWRQEPKVTGHGHYGHRLAFSPEGFLFITSGDRQKQTPAQEINSDLGKIIRLRDEGSVPDDNPWQESGEAAKKYWTMGHRNQLGIAFDSRGNLWQHEMGPRHGDELNLVKPGKNYGWPLVSEGSHYSGAAIARHNKAPQFEAPQAYWVPTIAPSGMVIYYGTLFSKWKGDALIGGLASRALIHVDLNGNGAKEVERFQWGERIREVEYSQDGSVYILEDGPQARLLQIHALR